MAQTESISALRFDNVSYFEPLTSIGLISEGFLESGVYNDSLSQVSRNLLGELIKKYSIQIHITKHIGIGDSTLRVRFLREELYMFQEMSWHPRDITSVQIEPVMDSLLMSTNNRYALLVVSFGYIRSKANYSAQMTSQLAMKFLVLGGARLPHKYSSGIYVMIVDDLYKHVVFFRKVYDPKADPLDIKVLDRQFQEIFYGQS
jgi:hypothetical protein